MHDADTGLIYMHHRYMDPQLGHFLNPDFRAPDIYDPTTFTEPYAYAAGNPMMFWDPNGLSIKQALQKRIHDEAMAFYERDKELAAGSLLQDPTGYNRLEVVFRFGMADGILDHAEGMYKLGKFGLEIGQYQMNSQMIPFERAGYTPDGYSPTMENIRLLNKWGIGGAKILNGIAMAPEILKMVTAELKKRGIKDPEVVYQIGKFLAPLLADFALGVAAEASLARLSNSIPRMIDDFAKWSKASTLKIKNSSFYRKEGSYRATIERGYHLNNLRNEIRENLIRHARAQHMGLTSMRQKRALNTVTAVYDKRTRRTYYGINRGLDRGELTRHPRLTEAFPEESLNRYALGNCAECDAVNRALHDGANWDDLVIDTIGIRPNGTVFSKDLCANCEHTFQGIPVINNP